MDGQDTARETELVDIKVSLGQILAKVEGINQRLDRLNGTVDRLQVVSNLHENALIVLNTEKAIIGKVFKPGLFILCVVVAGLLGHTISIDTIASLFK